MDARMSGDDRRRAELGNIPEASFIEVREIEHDAQRVARLHLSLIHISEPTRPY